MLTTLLKNEEVYYLENHKLLYIEYRLLQIPRHQVPRRVEPTKPVEGRVLAARGHHQIYLQSVLGVVEP